jgi:NTE family protein
VVRVPLTRRRLLLAGALGAVGAVGAIGALAGCTLNPDRNHNGPNAPRAAPLARPPRTAWVFSSGGPRGFAHVGVLKALDELGLVPDLVVGASAGSLVGSLYAAGLSARDIETLALDLQPLALARLAWGEDMLSGSAIADLVRSAAPQTQLERMPRAMACVAALCGPRLVNAHAGARGARARRRARAGG